MEIERTGTQLTQEGPPFRRGLDQPWGAPVEELRPGEVEWLEKVTNEQYQGKV